MKNLTDLFDLVNRKRFLLKYTNIKPESGINHRFTGKGTNSKDKKTGLTDEDKTAIKTGLETMRDDLTDVINTL